MVQSNSGTTARPRTWHHLNVDHLNVDRVLYRVTLTGDIPVGVDGVRSESVQGEAFSTKEHPNAKKRPAPRTSASRPERPPRKLVRSRAGRMVDSLARPRARIDSRQTIVLHARQSSATFCP
jgi:hypothetical protein